MAQINYRTINVDAFDPDSSVNFPMDSLLPATLPAPSNASEAANVATQVRQVLRSGDAEGALRYVLDTAPLAGDDRAKEVHMATVVDVLQGIRQGEMTRVLDAVCTGEGGSERADCLMKYLYKGMGGSQAPGSGTQTPKTPGSPQLSGGFTQIQARNFGEGGSAQQMSVLLSWHEKLVEVAGMGTVMRVMTDRRTV
ncbi:Arp2/3 complex 16 kDa subunit ARPC5 [Aspergillus campestris IBT 28561]|uniref:Actin-related protein 2/3 complex subunit 5 n=1 Tax=Aspergillus campestris (strain IBT 28561) TaxID=1392248 RepID=A0A2I1DE31_ASPC2|nr:Arp2/3 complex 16 kDa subunit ARPC5 [Aspergillus campestris IBT 28561]PKY08147.1 Arp2/3 complex 16 kDa subunit ARPC5 [Aspergillus campestris IBT 28561]